MLLTYTRQDIESTMPAVWSTTMALEDHKEQSRDAELQGIKGHIDPRRSNDRWAHCADIQRAWKLAPLTQRQRQVLYLRFAWGDLLQDIAHTLGITSEGTVSEHLDNGLAVIEAFLNGTELVEEVAA